MYADSVTKLKYQSATSRDVRADAAEFIVAKRLVDNPTETLEEIVRLVLLVSSKAPPASVRETEIEDIAEGFADAVYSAMECTTDGLN